MWKAASPKNHLCMKGSIRSIDFGLRGDGCSRVCMQDHKMEVFGKGVRRLEKDVVWPRLPTPRQNGNSHAQNTLCKIQPSRKQDSFQKSPAKLV